MINDKLYSGFECHTCGLCGNLKVLASSSSLEQCDGEYMTIQAGWNAYCS